MAQQEKEKNSDSESPSAGNSLPDNKLLAAVDIGSNSVHLIVARVVHGALQTLQRYKERVQLAAGLSDSHWLDDASIARGIQCLEQIGKILQGHQPDSVRVVATYTLRAARNRDVFLGLAEQVLGYPIDVISGREEARLIFQGVAHSETIREDILVVDIGGGSTELAVGSGFDPHFRESCRMGCVSFSNKFFAREISAKAFDRAHAAALQALEKYLPKLAKAHWSKVYATSGTAKTLQQYLNKSAEFEGAIETEALLRLRDDLIKKGDVEWLLDKGVTEDRLNLVPGGLAILIAISTTFGIDRVQYRDVALREGVLYELDEQMRHPNIRLRSRNSLGARYQIDTEFGSLVASTCEWLLNQVDSKWKRFSRQCKEILMEAAHLHEIGLQISATSLQKHSAYILANSDLPGYNQDQQALLALLVSQHRKRLKSESYADTRLISARDSIRLARLLRLAVILNVTRSPIDLSRLNISADADELLVTIEHDYLASNELLQADLQREQEYTQSAGFELRLVAV